MLLEMMQDVMSKKEEEEQQQLQTCNWPSDGGCDVQARLNQVAKRAEYQARQAAIAQDLPESKRWIDPALIERNFQCARDLPIPFSQQRQGCSACQT